MTTTTTVAIGLPVRNNAATVADAVRSVLAQRHRGWRLYVVDDGSSDGTVEILRRLQHPDVSVDVDGRSLGLAARLNQLARAAEAEVLVRMDADDLMHPARLGRTLDALESSGADLVAGHAISIDAASVPTGRRTSIPDASPAQALRFSPLIHPTVAGRTAWFRDHPYDESLARCQDQELWVRTMGQRRTAVLDDVLLYLREAGTVPAAKYAASMAGTRAIVRKYGPSLIGPGASARLLALTVAKEVAYRAAEPLGLVDRLVGRRAAPLPPAELAAHVEVIEGIRGVRLPGVDDA
jgi:hypothetical protein